MSKPRVISSVTTFTINDVSLREAVRFIQDRSDKLKRPTTEEAMGKLMGVSVDEFVAFLENEQAVPEGFTSKLLTAYGLRFVTGRQTNTMEAPEPLLPDVDPMESDE